MHHFTALCIGHLENTISLINVDIPMLTHFIMQFQEITVINTTTHLIRKIFVLECCQAHDGNKFSKILILN